MRTLQVSGSLLLTKRCRHRVCRSADQFFVIIYYYSLFLLLLFLFFFLSLLATEFFFGFVVSYLLFFSDLTDQVMHFKPDQIACCKSDWELLLVRVSH
jgi:hypothetical protein